MNPQEIAAELRRHHEICREFLALFTEENSALRGAQEWSSAGFADQRKRLLPQLESVLIRLRSCREQWTQMNVGERARCGEVNQLLRDVQNLLPRLLQLDRENQQEMLRHGVVPAAQAAGVAQTAAASQRPHFVAGLYQRHAAT